MLPASFKFTFLTPSEACTLHVSDVKKWFEDSFIYHTESSRRLNISEYPSDSSPCKSGVINSPRDQRFCLHILDWCPFCWPQLQGGAFRQSAIVWLISLQYTHGRSGYAFFALWWPMTPQWRQALGIFRLVDAARRCQSFLTVSEGVLSHLNCLNVSK